MQIPAAGFIEMARDDLAHVTPEDLADQERELREAITPPAGVAFVNGYHLGLQVARIMLSASPLLGAKGIDANDLL